MDTFWGVLYALFNISTHKDFFNAHTARGGSRRPAILVTSYYYYERMDANSFLILAAPKKIATHFEIAVCNILTLTLRITL